ncbi:ATP-binding protein [Leclercia adecarboxylata]|uniref:ATP-binding protein n=1 Tax=Leclercia TaxID=83654 RepID=UPI000CD1EBDA|nr:MULTISPECIES: ATP-binding protein [Leclercia]POV35977.1 ATP-binding protein [Leclercia sp. LSNIH5]POW69078.1 ATP-binding protein [Leclercia sp. LSNIH2]AUU85684.1 ATP-binding protein [Leclercia sp. LSNIH1]MEB5750353.1 ATP-binding protein [Leclercia adecarboxylata]UYM55804.1 ATP-binding protein [Leclercia adecarboxylata]
MAVAHEIALPAALSSLSPLAEWLAQQMASLPVDETWRFALDLAACETATNIIRYALHEDQRQLFNVTFIAADAGVTLRFTDAGTPFPAERLAAARDEAFDDDTLLAESGRGLRLILLSVDSFDLERRDGKNIAVLEKGW